MNSKIKHCLKYKYILTIAVFIAFIGFVGENSLVNRFEKKKEIMKLESEIDEYNRKFMEDKFALERLQNDPEAVEEVARSKYYMKTDNEDVFIFENAE